jgi:octaprenyl-diphosphate synthase
MSAVRLGVDPTLADAMDLVEARLSELLESREPLLTEISTYLVGSGGKRARPAVTLMIYRACGGEKLDDIVDVATALELIHSATLLHDDIIDNSDTRRGKDSAFRKYGIANALVTGDFVFSRAFQLCARFEEKLIRWAAEACISLTEGEVMQARFRNNPAVTLDDYLEIISRKTASIFRQGARTAAYLAAAPAAVVEAMARCGYNVGMTFQIVDDLLDVDGKVERLGKPIGIDLRDGNPSLPIVLALEAAPEMARIFRQTDPGPDDVRQAIEIIRASRVLDRVRQMAADYAARARDDMSSLRPSNDRDQLLRLIDQLMERTE